ncbi:MAG: UDP-N-acetylmuramate dehydrogenase [Patescibacteria group bacterium]|nr:UDP-N-acetylmuramate dehydrogenase [Patescibacteria group bacterium]
MDIEEYVPFSRLTTFRTGGPVRFLLTLKGESEIPEARAFAEKKALPLVPLGGGSNMLAPDQGLEAACVRFAPSSIVVSESEDTRLYAVEAGASWDVLVAHAVADGSWGVENLSAIPGTAGAAVVQNIGAYGAALSDTFEKAVAVDLGNGELVEFSKDDCAFGYRTSVFKENRDRYLITKIFLRLSKTPRPNISYRDLKNRFEGAVPALADIRNAVIEIRKGKFPSLSEFGTAGSFFLNPIVMEAETFSLRARFPEMPVFDLPEGGVKIPLAWLFDHVLNVKGMRIGKAFVWEKQPLVIAAEMGASTRDIVSLSEKIADLLYEKTAIGIIPEVRVIERESR